MRLKINWKHFCCCDFGNATLMCGFLRIWQLMRFRRTTFLKYSVGASRILFDCWLLNVTESLLSTFHSIAQQSSCKKAETQFSVCLQDFRAIMCKIQLPFELEIGNAFELMFVGYHCCVASRCRRNQKCRMTSQTNGIAFAKQSFTQG